MCLNENAGVFAEAKRLKKTHSGEIENRGVPKAVFLWQTFQGNVPANDLVVSILVSLLVFHIYVFMWVCYVFAVMCDYSCGYTVDILVGMLVP